MLPTLRSSVRQKALAVSLIKVIDTGIHRSNHHTCHPNSTTSKLTNRPTHPQGLDFADGKPVLVSQIIREGMGPAASEVCVLMGANVADEVARDEVCSYVDT